MTAEYPQGASRRRRLPHPPLLPALGRRHRHRAAALGRRPAPRRRTSPRRPRPRCPGPGNPGSRRDRPGSLPRGRRWLTGTGEPVTDDPLDGLPPAALAAVRQVAEELTVRESVIFLDGREFIGEPPGLRTVQRGQLMLVYLTDVRGDRVVIIQVNWIS